MDWSVVLLLLREPGAIWKVPLTLLLGPNIVYITFRSVFNMVRTAITYRHGVVPSEAGHTLWNQFIQLVFILACAIVILTILLMIWGIPRVLIQSKGSLYQLNIG